MAEGRIYMPKDSFVVNLDGVDVTFVKGRTLVREGHRVLLLYGTLFEPVRVDYEVEEATAVPGGKRSR